MLLSYHFFVTKGLFQLLLMRAFQDNWNTCFLKILTPLVKNSSFCNKKLFFSIFPMSTTLPHIYEHVLWWLFINILLTNYPGNSLRKSFGGLTVPSPPKSPAAVNRNKLQLKSLRLLMSLCAVSVFPRILVRLTLKWFWVVLVR